ncbi:MAG: ECF transporter S component [Lachnospiraceae bacterium]|nr:ECF transporter S component [Lachnospiraceae bacterium]MBR2275394.1 ECF transporter S component [Lachnospiraceae bacterium]
MNDNKTAIITRTALFAALTALATLVIQIPIPGTGYVNPGDGIVLLSGLFLGPVYGALAAGLGAGIADLISGYVIYAPATLVIKALCAFTAAKLFALLDSRNNRTGAPIGKFMVPNMIFSGIISELVMTAGYFLYEGLVVLKGAGGLSVSFAGALAGVPFNLIQGIIGVVLSTALYPLLRRLNASV